MADALESPRTVAGGPPPRRVRRGAKALISSSERVLLVRERHADGSPFWTLPGGGVKSDESLAEGLRRELSEELRCPSEVETPVTTFPYTHSSLRNTVTVYAVFECTLGSEPTPCRAEGIEACLWVTPTDLPSSTLPAVERVLAEETARVPASAGTRD